MSTEGMMMGHVRGSWRRKATLDLNAPPPESSRDHVGPSTQAAPPPTMIDVEALDDDVIESSPRAFAEAKNKSRRRRAVVVDLVSGPTTRLTNSGVRSRRQRISSSQSVINCDRYINLESSVNKKKEDVPKPPPPPKEPTFACPICMGPLKEEMSTRCGHIFCKDCIKKAIGVQAKCPTCRKRVIVKELIRVFLPTTN
ncbi:hypothetical protein ACFE04_030314 [Oxalis oulophora]